MSISPRRSALAGGATLVVIAGIWLALDRSVDEPLLDEEAVIRDVLSEDSEASVRAACSTCHVFPEPDILPREFWPVAIRGMYQIAEQRGIDLTLNPDRAFAWYVLNAPERLPEATGRTDAGPGSVTWELTEWRPQDARPAVTHVQMAPLFGPDAMDVIVSDVSTNRVYALRPYAPDKPAVDVGPVPNPGRVSVTDLDGDGALDLVVAALGSLAPTNDPVGSIVWFRRTEGESFERTPLVEGLGRVADVQAADLQGNGRMDLVVAVFGWMENGSLLWLENSGMEDGRSTFVQHVLDARSGFTDVRVEDLNQDGRLDVVAVIAQEFQQVMVYWATEEGYRTDLVYQAPNPDWGFTGLEVADFTGNGLPDLIVTNGDNLDLTVAKPYHGVGLLENLDGRFEYRHLTSMYGAHRAVPVDLTGAGALGLVVSAYLPPSVAIGAPRPSEAVLWLERVGPSQLVRRVLQADGVHHMTMATGDATGDGMPDLALGLMDLGVVDPGQAHQGEPLASFLTLWRNLGVQAPPTGPRDAPVIDWRAGEPADSLR